MIAARVGVKPASNCTAALRFRWPALPLRWSPFRWRAASARRPGGGGGARGVPHLLLLFVVRPGGGPCAASHADARSRNLDRKCGTFRARADAHAADGAIPRRNPVVPADDLFGIQKAAAAPPENASSRQSRRGKRGEWRARITANPREVQRKFPAIDRHVCFAAFLLLFCAADGGVCLSF